MNRKISYLTFFLLVFSYATFAQPGKLDSSFGKGGELELNFNKGMSRFKTAALQQDGKIILAGTASTDFLLVRLYPDGNVDKNFGNEGHIIIPLYFTDDALHRILIQPDGKILICGTARTIGDKGSTTEGLIVRLNSDGSLDSTFDGDGLKYYSPIAYNSTAFDMVMQSNSKVVVLMNHALVRLNSDGSIDNTFDCPLNGAFVPSRLLVQADDKLVLTGTDIDANNKKNNEFSASRFTPDGALDTNFDGDGHAVIAMSPNNDEAFAAALQNDGKIMIGGSSADGAGANKDFAVARLNADGSLDTGFDGDGKAFIVISDGDDIAYAITTHSNGKIEVIGTSYKTAGQNAALVQLNADGSLDTGFDIDGKIELDAGTQGNDVILTRAGKICVAAERFEVYSSPTLAILAAVFQLNPNGSFDDTFSGDGKEFFEFGNGDDQGFSAAIQPDGKILVAGSSFTNGQNQNFSMARLNEDGNLDPTFAANGKLLIDWGSDVEYCTDIAVKTNGKILAAGVIGRINQRLALAQLNPDGTLDAGFASNGKLEIAVTGYAFPVKLAVQPDEKVIISLDNASATESATVIRLNANGSYDNSFDTDGKKEVKMYLKAVALQADGKIVLTGYGIGGGIVIRLNADGSPDSGFDTDGEVQIEGLNEAYAVALQPDGKMVVGGHKSYNPVLARLNTDGSMDTSFDGDGIVTTPFSNVLNQMITGLGIESNGKIVAGGRVHKNSQPASIDYFALRLHSDGSYDQSFNGNGIVVIERPYNEHLTDLTIDRKGRILLTGTNHHKNDYYIVRLTGSDPTGTGLTEAKMDEVILYPNPSQGKFRFVLPTKTQAKSHVIKVFNSNGSSVYFTTGASDASIDMSSFGPGIYYILIDAGGTQYHSKLIIE